MKQKKQFLIINLFLLLFCFIANAKCIGTYHIDKNKYEIKFTKDAWYLFYNGKKSPLPVEGLSPKCIKALTFNKAKMFVIEHDLGAAGTSTILRETALLIYKKSELIKTLPIKEIKDEGSTVTKTKDSTYTIVEKDLTLEVSISDKMSSSDNEKVQTFVLK